jgi:hypothetical protein
MVGDWSRRLVSPTTPPELTGGVSLMTLPRFRLIRAAFFFRELSGIPQRGDAPFGVPAGGG